MPSDPTPREAEIEAAEIAYKRLLWSGRWDGPQTRHEALAAALIAAYAIRLPPLLAELERLRTALEEK